MEFLGIGAHGHKWEEGKKRPWNAFLKTLLAFKIGKSFVKVKNRPDAYYGQAFADRKVTEWQDKLSGKLVDQAPTWKERVKTSTDAYQWYSGKIAPESALAPTSGEGRRERTFAAGSIARFPTRS